MLDPEILARVATFCMATGNWPHGFQLLRRGLSAGYPDAHAYKQPYATYVEYALNQHRNALGSGGDVDIWVKRLKELFVLQAYNVRYLVAKLACPFQLSYAVLIILFPDLH